MNRHICDLVFTMLSVQACRCAPQQKPIGMSHIKLDSTKQCRHTVCHTVSVLLICASSDTPARVGCLRPGHRVKQPGWMTCMPQRRACGFLRLVPCHHLAPTLADHAHDVRRHVAHRAHVSRHELVKHRHGVFIRQPADALAQPPVKRGLCDGGVVACDCLPGALLRWLRQDLQTADAAIWGTHTSRGAARRAPRGRGPAVVILIAPRHASRGGCRWTALQRRVPMARRRKRHHAVHLGGGPPVLAHVWDHGLLRAAWRGGHGLQVLLST
mmetsp:Transcript_31967/g.95468  ORF Transcript_31967/g.95468 Transcript_31967/m.95468 type:complete len:270 (-) Transcript_31967:779-1588(-)